MNMNDKSDGPKGPSKGTREPIPSGQPLPLVKKPQALPPIPSVAKPRPGGKLGSHLDEESTLVVSINAPDDTAASSALDASIQMNPIPMTPTRPSISASLRVRTPTQPSKIPTHPNSRAHAQSKSNSAHNPTPNQIQNPTPTPAPHANPTVQIRRPPVEDPNAPIARHESNAAKFIDFAAVACEFANRKLRVASLGSTCVRSHQLAIYQL